MQTAKAGFFLNCGRNLTLNWGAEQEYGRKVEKIVKGATGEIAIFVVR
jgi:hypothetical protein